MFPTIHDYTASNLESQGYGALSECLSAEVSEELNGGFTLALRYPLKGTHYEYLIPGNVIVAKPSHNQTRQAFRINQVVKSFANSITVYANHISYDLSGYAVKNAVSYGSLSETISAMNSVSYANPGVYHQFTFQTDIASVTPFNMSGVQTLRSWMGGQTGSILDVYGGEWIYDNFTCTLTSRRGEDTGVRISYGKNLAEYQKERDYSQYSHICAFWKKGEISVCGDFIATNSFCTFRVAYVDASNYFENQPTTAQLNTYANTQITSASINAETITVTPAQIGNESIGLGDSVLICYEGVFETRVIKTVWDVLAGVYKTLELGTKKANIADTIKSLTATGEKEADYIVDKGTVNGWNYKKWASGVYECWIRDSSKKATITQPWGSFYYGTISAWTYPITFVGDYPVVNITVQANNGGCWAVPNYADYSFTSTGTIYVYRPSTVSNMNITVNIIAIGRWKN